MDSPFCLSHPERGSNLHLRLLWVPGQLVVKRRGTWATEGLSAKSSSGVQRHARFWPTPSVTTKLQLTPPPMNHMNRQINTVLFKRHQKASRRMTALTMFH